MYKNSSKFFNRSTAWVIDPSLAKAADRRDKKLQAQHDRDRGNRNPCPECGVLFLLSDLSRHAYKAHRLCKCGYCQKFVAQRILRGHIKRVHGLKTFFSWLRRKEASPVKVSKSSSERGMGVCPRCGRQMRRGRLAKHLLNAHGLRQCENCFEVMPPSEFDRHLEEERKAKLRRSRLIKKEKER